MEDQSVTSKKIEDKYQDNLKGVQVGDRVWGAGFGWGEVKGIDDSDSPSYPIVVEFQRVPSLISYTRQGRYRYDDGFPSLFFSEIEFQIPPAPERKFIPEKYDIILVSDNGRCWSLGIFSHISDFGTYTTVCNEWWRQARPFDKKNPTPPSE